MFLFSFHWFYRLVPIFKSVTIVSIIWPFRSVTIRSVFLSLPSLYLLHFHFRSFLISVLPPWLSSLSLSPCHSLLSWSPCPYFFLFRLSFHFFSSMHCRVPSHFLASLSSIVFCGLHCPRCFHFPPSLPHHPLSLSSWSCSLSLPSCPWSFSLSP